eukprot:1077106-Prymnesium_polylepis.1
MPAPFWGLAHGGCASNEQKRSNANDCASRVLGFRVVLVGYTHEAQNSSTCGAAAGARLLDLPAATQLIQEQAFCVR